MGSITFIIRNKQANNRAELYKRELIKTDSLRESALGSYRKLVNDLSTQKDLNKQLKTERGDLFKELKKLKSKVKSISDISLKPQDAVTVTIVKRDTVTGESNFTDYYPSKADAFITYSGKIKNDSLTADWSFDTLGINMVVYEKLKGVYEVDLKAPSWIQVTDLQVNSLPMETKVNKPIRFLMGAEARSSFRTFEPVVGVGGGITTKNTIYIIKVDTEQRVGAGVYKIF